MRAGRPKSKEDGDRKNGAGRCYSVTNYRSSSAEKAENYPALLRRPAPFVCEGRKEGP